MVSVEDFGDLTINEVPMRSPAYPVVGKAFYAWGGYGQDPVLGPPAPPMHGPRMPEDYERWQWLRATLDLTPLQAELLDDVIGWAENNDDLYR